MVQQLSKRYAYALRSLRGAASPAQHDSLSGVVVVAGEWGKGYAHIRFDEDTVTRIGQVMPQGVGPEHPVYLKAIQAPTGDWRVFAMYLGNERRVLLYHEKEKPQWLKKIHRS